MYVAHKLTEWGQYEEGRLRHGMRLRGGSRALRLLTDKGYETNNDVVLESL